MCWVIISFFMLNKKRRSTKAHPFNYGNEFEFEKCWRESNDGRFSLWFCYVWARQNQQVRSTSGVYVCNFPAFFFARFGQINRSWIFRKYIYLCELVDFLCRLLRLKTHLSVLFVPSQSHASYAKFLQSLLPNHQSRIVISYWHCCHVYVSLCCYTFFSVSAYPSLSIFSFTLSHQAPTHAFMYIVHCAQTLFVMFYVWM